MFDMSWPIGSSFSSWHTLPHVLEHQPKSPAVDVGARAAQLRITPRGQAEFLHRMLAGELPVKRSNVELVWRLLEIESGPGFTFRGKTGLGSQDGRAIGWLVGYVEREGHRWIYATLVRGRAGADVDAEMTRLTPLRKSITRALLTAHVLPSPVS